MTALAVSAAAAQPSRNIAWHGSAYMIQVQQITDIDAVSLYEGPTPSNSSSNSIRSTRSRITHPNKSHSSQDRHLVSVGR
jgi:hypothetical protein